MSMKLHKVQKFTLLSGKTANATTMRKLGPAAIVFICICGVVAITMLGMCIDVLIEAFREGTYRLLVPAVVYAVACASFVYFIHATVTWQPPPEEPGSAT
jgi:hypothetical protein